jgi:hypothetical protein
MGLGILERVSLLDRPLPSLPASEVGVVTVFVPYKQTETGIVYRQTR